MWFRMARPRSHRAKVHTPAKTLILVNPVAGGGYAERARPHVADYLCRQGFRAEFAQSRSGEDLQRLAREGVAAGCGRIVALGGDGTFQQIVKATLGSQVVLGFFPAGGGNDIAAALGIPQGPGRSGTRFSPLPAAPYGRVARASPGTTRAFTSAVAAWASMPRPPGWPMERFGDCRAQRATSRAHSGRWHRSRRSTSPRKLTGSPRR